MTRLAAAPSGTTDPWNSRADRWISRAAATTVAALAGIAGAISYSHMRQLALDHGQAGWHAHAFPLQKLGVTEIPILVMNVSNPGAELPPVIAGVPREMLMGPRPPLAKDILSDAFNIHLSVKRRIKQLTIMMNANQYGIPI